MTSFTSKSIIYTGLLCVGYNIVRLYIEKTNADISSLKMQIHNLSTNLSLIAEMVTAPKMIRDNSTITDIELEIPVHKEPLEETHEIQEYEYIEKKDPNTTEIKSEPETEPKTREKSNSISAIWSGITENIIYF